MMRCRFAAPPQRGPRLEATLARAGASDLGNVRFAPYALAVAMLIGCDSGPTARPAATSQPELPPDRLQPGEKLPGVETTFGIEVPRGMEVTARFPDVVQLRGRVPLPDLVKYYKQHVKVAAIELGNNQAVFPALYVNGDQTKRVYRIVITDQDGRRSIRMTDETKPPAVRGLTEAERWQRAGLQPDGTQQDRLKVY